VGNSRFTVYPGQANTADCDAVAGAQRHPIAYGRGDGNASRTLALFDGQHGACGFYQPSEHLSLIRSLPT
jgi:hypothetical protein